MPTRTITTKSLAILIACLTPAVAEPLSITGPARVVDRDTVVVAGTHVRLKGLLRAPTIIEMGAALACPRYSTRYVQFEQAEALAAQPRATVLRAT